MSILSRYLLRLHLVPFLFAMSAMTGIMLVNQVAKRLGDLVGKGLPWYIIVEVFALSVPFIVAMTLPMAVLVSILYTMGRLTVGNELTAMRSSGVSLAQIMRPLVAGGIVVAGIAFAFSDQVLPRANHKLRALLTDISRTKPTFGIEEQVFNEVKRSSVFLRAGTVEPATFTLRDVSILDISDHNRKRVTYADSAHMAFAPNQEDLILTLFDGVMHETDRVNAANFQLAEFHTDRVRVEGVAGNFTRTLNDTYKGDREMGVCEMDSVVVSARRERWTSQNQAQRIELNSLRSNIGLAPAPIDTVPPRFRPRLYCRALERLAALPRPTAAAAQERPPTPDAAAQAPFQGRPSIERRTAPPPRITSARVFRDRASSANLRIAQYLVELHKKYAIAAACLVFVLVGVPAAIKFPRGGVGLVVGMSLVIFTIYYVGLIGGESLANRGAISPFWAMWTPNIVFAVMGCAALWHVRAEATAGRGGRRRSRIKTKTMAGASPTATPGSAHA